MGKCTRPNVICLCPLSLMEDMDVSKSCSRLFTSGPRETIEFSGNNAACVFFSSFRAQFKVWGVVVDSTSHYYGVCGLCNRRRRFCRPPPKCPLRPGRKCRMEWIRITIHVVGGPWPRALKRRISPELLSSSSLKCSQTQSRIRPLDILFFFP